MRVGVIGDTFDPVHYGHLILADQIAEYMKLSKVLFIPSNNPPHKDVSKIAPVEYRLEMIKLAISGNEVFELSTIEYEHAGKNYSYETLIRLGHIFEEGTEFYFIIGSDVLYDLLTFKNFEELSARCRFAVAIRPGTDMPELSRAAERLRLEYGARIHIVPFNEIDLSSTIIRERIFSGKSVRYMLPEDVRRYIETKGLYRG